MRKILILTALLGCIAILQAQKSPIRFGKPAMDELEMTSYEYDTSAVAVVLCQYGYFDPNLIRYSNTIRIKILKPEGVEWANWKFRADNETNIEGFVFNLENGQMVKEKLKSASVYREKLFDEYYQYRVAFPNVKVGTVIDLEYSQFLIPTEFYFQYDIPVKWSELVIYEHNAIAFSKNFFGFVPLEVATPTRWVASKVPAFKSEPYINSENNYKTHFEFDLKSVTLQGYKYRPYATSWENLNKLLLNDFTDFGMAITGITFLNEDAQQIQQNYSTPKEKMIAAFDLIKKIKWDGNERLGISNAALVTAYKNATGNSADINLSLLVLLRKLDIDAEPVAISTRSNGMLSDFFPSLNKLNYVLVAAYLDNQVYLLDATERYMPYTLLPARTLNGKGRIISKSRSDWIPLVCDKKDKTTFYYDLALQSNLNITGILNASYTDFAALEFRKRYYNFTDEDEFLLDFEKSNPGYKIQSAQIQNLDSLLIPIKTNYTVEITDHAEMVGDQIHLNLFFDQLVAENPFRQDKRSANIDFVSPEEISMTVKLTLPDKTSVVSLPKPARVSLPENGGSITYNATASGNAIMMNFRWSLNRSKFTVVEYDYLKEFYNQLIMKQSEPIVLSITAE